MQLSAYPYIVGDTGQARELWQHSSPYSAAHPLPGARQQGVSKNAPYEQARVFACGSGGYGDQQSSNSSLWHHAFLTLEGGLCHICHLNI